MEELQDAIEDAQYMNAMHDDSPKPTKEWKIPTTEELSKYTNGVLQKNPKAFEPEEVCSGPLGFYMFTKYLKHHGLEVLSRFLVDVATYRANLVNSIHFTSKKIVADYLADGSTGNLDPPGKRPPELIRFYKSRRPQVDFLGGESSKAAEGARGDAEGVENLPDLKSIKWSDFIRSDESRNALGIVGEPVTRLIADVKGNKKVAVEMFDEVERIVFAFACTTQFSNFKSSSEWTKFMQFMTLTETTVNEDDFSLFRVLGRGGFGMVNGCKRCYSGKLFAMKVMNKKRVKMKKAEALCMNERNILTVVESPFVVCLKYSFATPTDLYLILDIMIGGDLGFHLARKGRFSLTETKFYSARILAGIAALHDLSIVYRDLKPENILMDELGYTRISDLGLACRVGRSGLSGTCGTRGYWAPEMLRRDEAGKRERYFLSVDWFSFGCCVYEFMYGISPFRTERARNWGDFPKVEKADKDRAIDLAIQEMEPDFDDTFDSESKDFISRLLDKNSRTRLGANGYKEIMEHPWFANAGFSLATLNTLTPPFAPAKDINMATQSEIGSFSDEKAAKKLVLTEEDHKNYDGWHFIANKFFQEEVVEFLCFEELMGPIKPESYGSSCCCTIS